jgi:hypothetical protein
MSEEVGLPGHPNQGPQAQRDEVLAASLPRPLAAMTFRAALASDTKSNDGEAFLFEPEVSKYLEVVSQGVLSSPRPTRKLVCEAFAAILESCGWDAGRRQHFCDELWRAASRAAERTLAAGNGPCIEEAARRKDALLQAKAILADHVAGTLVGEEEREQRKQRSKSKRQIARKKKRERDGAAQTLVPGTDLPGEASSDDEEEDETFARAAFGAQLRRDADLNVVSSAGDSAAVGGAHATPNRVAEEVASSSAGVSLPDPVKRRHAGDCRWTVKTYSEAVERTWDITETPGGSIGEMKIVETADLSLAMGKNSATRTSEVSSLSFSISDMSDAPSTFNGADNCNASGSKPVCIPVAAYGERGGADMTNSSDQLSTVLEESMGSDRLDLERDISSHVRGLGGTPLSAWAMRSRGSPSLALLAPGSPVFALPPGFDDAALVHPLATGLGAPFDWIPEPIYEDDASAPFGSVLGGFDLPPKSPPTPLLQKAPTPPSPFLPPHLQKGPTLSSQFLPPHLQTVPTPPSPFLPHSYPSSPLLQHGFRKQISSRSRCGTQDMNLRTRGVSGERSSVYSTCDVASPYGTPEMVWGSTPEGTPLHRFSMPPPAISEVWSPFADGASHYDSRSPAAAPHNVTGAGGPQVVYVPVYAPHNCVHCGRACTQPSELAPIHAGAPLTNTASDVVGTHFSMPQGMTNVAEDRTLPIAT